MAHLDQDELAKRVEDAKAKVEVGATYSHYKHDDQLYTIVSIALLEATGEPVVVYKALYGAGIIFVRPVTVWLETVEWEGREVPRFTKLNQPAR